MSGQLPFLHQSYLSTLPTLRRYLGEVGTRVSPPLNRVDAQKGGGTENPVGIVRRCGNEARLSQD